MVVDPLEALSRCLHVLAAILLFGGSLFIRNVLMPSAAALPEEPHQLLKQSVSRRWRYYVAGAIAVLIFTGFYNYLAIKIPQHKGDRAYHMWMGIKILVSFVVFFLASALAGRSRRLEKIRQHSQYWLSLTLMLATLVVVIAGVLKVRGAPARPPVPAAAQQPPAI